ncbi:MAG TPA: cyclase family protein [Actinoplanes sp.]|nr:cyclase family protein [Actinoplanes sp.]
MSTAVPDLSAVRLVSLSHVNDPATTSLYPGDPPFRLTAVAADGYHLQYAEQGEHTGTHWGAPAHFEPGGLTADALNPADLFRPAVCIDVRDRVAADADYGVSVADLRSFEQAHGPIPAQAAVIAWTGWSSRWGTPAFANAGPDGVLHQPGFTLDAVNWLLETGRLGRRGALGTDTFGPDRGVDTSYAVSRALYREHRISLECLTNLESLPPTGAWVLVGGPLNRNGSGSPATIWALLPPS